MHLIATMSQRSLSPKSHWIKKAGDGLPVQGARELGCGVGVLPPQHTPPPKTSWVAGKFRKLFFLYNVSLDF